MINVNGGETRYYYHFDGLGSVVALSDSSGNVVEQYRYDVFGTPDITSSVGNRFMFTGREYDTETSLYYYRARFYKSSIGRFLQPDPISYVGGLNLYTYCGNNPINFVDPMGLRVGEVIKEGEYKGFVDAGNGCYVEPRAYQPPRPYTPKEFKDNMEALGTLGKIAGTWALKKAKEQAKSYAAAKVIEQTLKTVVGLPANIAATAATFIVLNPTPTGRSAQYVLDMNYVSPNPELVPIDPSEPPISPKPSAPSVPKRPVKKKSGG